MTDWNEHEDAISDVISDSIDMDWTSRTGAKAVVAWLNENAAAPVRRACEGRVWGFKPPLDAGEVLTVLDALLSEIAALRGEVAEWRETVRFNERCWSEERGHMIDRFTQAERQRDEAKSMLIRARDLAISYPANAVAKAIRRDINAFLANQGADQ